MKGDFQRRALGRSELQSRTVDGKATQIFGYAAVFNSVANGEVIRPGAFTKTLSEHPDVKAYWNHDSSMVLARTSNGTLTLREDGKGLYCELTPNPDTSWGRDALAACARGDVKGMSFGFKIVKAGIITEGGEEITEILEVALREVSPCADPWYEATEVNVRKTASSVSLDARRRELEILELVM